MDNIVLQPVIASGLQGSCPFLHLVNHQPSPCLLGLAFSSLPPSREQMPSLPAALCTDMNVLTISCLEGLFNQSSWGFPPARPLQSSCCSFSCSLCAFENRSYLCSYLFLQCFGLWYPCGPYSTHPIPPPLSLIVTIFQGVSISYLDTSKQSSFQKLNSPFLSSFHLWPFAFLYPSIILS